MTHDTMSNREARLVYLEMPNKSPEQARGESTADVKKDSPAEQKKSFERQRTAAMDETLRALTKSYRRVTNTTDTPGIELKNGSYYFRGEKTGKLYKFEPTPDKSGFFTIDHDGQPTEAKFEDKEVQQDVPMIMGEKFSPQDAQKFIEKNEPQANDLSAIKEKIDLA